MYHLSIIYSLRYASERGWQPSTWYIISDKICSGAGVATIHLVYNIRNSGWYLYGRPNNAFWQLGLQVTQTFRRYSSQLLMFFFRYRLIDAGVETTRLSHKQFWSRLTQPMRQKVYALARWPAVTGTSNRRYPSPPSWTSNTTELSGVIWPSGCERMIHRGTRINGAVWKCTRFVQLFSHFLA